MNEQIQKEKGLKAVLIYLVVFYLISVIVSLVVGEIAKLMGIDLNIAENIGFANSYVNVIVYIILFVALFIFYFKELKSDFINLKKSNKNIILTIVGSFFIFYIINIIPSMFTSNIEYYAEMANNFFIDGFNIVTTSDNQAYIESIINSPHVWTMFVAAGLLGPICEELVFRKSFFALFKTKEMGLLVSSLVFGLIHILSSLLQGYSFMSMMLMTIPYILSGVALGYVYIKNDCNILIPTIVHIASNLFSMIMILIMY